MIKLGKHFSVSPLAPVLFIGAYFGNFLQIYITAFIFAVLHEFAHIAAAFKFGVPIEKVELQPFGITAKLKEHYIKEPYKEIFIALAGPAFNFFAASVCHILIRHHSLDLTYIMWLNLSMAILNLLPCLPLDGGRVVKALLTDNWGIVKAFNTMIRLTKIMTAAILAGAVLLLLYSDFNFSLILIAAFLLANISAERRNLNIIAMKEMLQNKEKLKRDDINKVRTIAVFEDVSARILLKYFSYNYYYVIDVVDKDMKITNRVTETQLIDALITKGVRVKIKDV